MAGNPAAFSFAFSAGRSTVFTAAQRAITRDAASRARAIAAN